MTETLTTSRETGVISPEQALANAKEALKVDNIDILRLEQKDTLEATQGDIDSEEFRRECDELARTYLENHGVTPSDPKYDQYLEVVRQFSYDQMSNRDWRVGEPTNDDPHMRASGQLMLINQIQPIIFGESLDLSGGKEKDDDDAELGTTRTEPATTRTEPSTARTRPAVVPPVPSRASLEVSTTPVVPSANSSVPLVPYQGAPSPSDTEPTVDTTPTVDILPNGDPDDDVELLDDGQEIERSLDLLRTRMARLSAKRQRQTGLRNKLSNKKYNQTQRWYTAAVIEAGRRTHAQEIADAATTEDEKRALATQFILEEQAKLRNASLELVKNTKVSKFIEWMTRGSKTARIAKGVLVGGAGAAAGAGLVVASAGVSAAVIFGGALTFAGRYARGYAAHDAKHGRGIATDIDSDAAKTALESKFDDQGAADHFYTATDHFTEEFNKDIKLEQKKRRKTVYKTVGQLALGAGAGAAVAYASESGLIEAAANKAKDAYENLRIANTTGVGGEAIAAPSDAFDSPTAEFPSDGSSDLNLHEQSVNEQGGDLADTGSEAGGVDTPESTPTDTGGSADIGAGEGANDSGVSAVEAVPYEYSTDALTIKPGEGWYETFKNVGVVDEQARKALLSDEGLMQQLKDMGLAYKDEELVWGMNMTSDGKMPREALDLIRESAQSHHFTLAA